MRRTASEVLRNLEMRVARLERQADSEVYQMKLKSFSDQLEKDIKSLFDKYNKLENPEDELIQLFNGFADSRGQISYKLNAILNQLGNIMGYMDEASDKLSK